MPWKRYFPLSSLGAVGLAGGTACCLALTLILTGCTMSKLTRSGEDFAPAETCGKCHVDIFHEWSDSPHAQAYTNPRFASSTDDYRFDRCLGCHAPEPKYYEETPQVRQNRREDGITCVSCHLEESKLSGPIEPSGLVAPHPVNVSDDRYKDSRFCGRCHEGTLAEWQQSQQDDKLTCQECHMPKVHRKLTQPTGWFSELIVAFEEPTATKRHSFELIPEELPEKPVSAELVVRDLQAVLTINNHLPHALPCGDFGMRIVSIEAEVIDNDGKASQTHRWELTSAGKGALPECSSRDFVFELPGQSRAVRVRLVRFGRDGANTSVLLEQEFTLK